MGNWPADADGDVFRRLEEDGCDFTQPYDIDFFVDFESWPPSEEALAALTEAFGDVEIMEEDEEEPPAVVVTIDSLLTYEFVTETQAKITEVAKPFGGACMDWGVML